GAEDQNSRSTSSHGFQPRPVLRRSWRQPEAWHLTLGQSRRSTVRTVQDRKIVSLTAALQWIVFAEWEGRELVGKQNPAQVRVTFEDNAKHVEYFALQPISAGPQRHGRRH